MGRSRAAAAHGERMGQLRRARCELDKGRAPSRRPRHRTSLSGCTGRARKAERRPRPVTAILIRTHDNVVVPLRAKPRYRDVDEGGDAMDRKTFIHDICQGMACDAERAEAITLVVFQELRGRITVRE